MPHLDNACVPGLGYTKCIHIRIRKSPPAHDLPDSVVGVVAESLQVSHTPVREALCRLQSEDVLAKGNQGVVVVEIGEDELVELHDLRETRLDPGDA